ncbi:MAG: ABC-F family ATP-binding cassette domain-containing protein [Defluviitaleaceae bacterium]|nr:ABC-F family ATP-binding cassette domain-containing protein [Defluviitaleaceae bacterium]
MMVTKMLLSVNNLTKSFGDTPVLKEVSLTLARGEKAAIIGRNGAGKTTLFRILTGEMAADGGDVAFPREHKLGYMSQASALTEGNTIHAEMLSVFAPIIELEERLRRTEAEMARSQGDELTALMSKYSKLSQQFEAARGFEYKSRVRGVMRGLALGDETSVQPISTYSGGEKTRISLAKLLLTEPDLLLLDEPTNHLDISATQWLEDFLRAYPHAVMLISHDRYFIDRVCTKVIDIEHGAAKTYNGNYSFAAAKKAKDREIETHHYESQQREIKRQEEVIRKLKSFNREKSVKRAESREKLLAKVERLEKPANLPDSMRMRLNPRRASGIDVLFVRDLRKSFGGDPLFTGISFDIRRGEKVALIGANGIGKTTLARIVHGDIPRDGGSIMLGHGVTVGWYDQEHRNLDPAKTLYDEIYDSFPYLTVTQVRSALGAFMFRGDEVFKRVGELSGGEKGRVSLAKLMLGEANFIIMDEPTNHLDIYSKEVLEQTLRDYTGTVLYISHDRYFINNTADKIVALSPVSAAAYLGNYDYYLSKLAESAPEVESAATQDARGHISSLPAPSSAKTAESPDAKARNRSSDKRVRQLKAELSRVEREIESAEAQIAQYDEALASEEVYTDHVKADEVFTSKSRAEEKLSELYAKWESLQEEAWANA